MTLKEVMEKIFPAVYKTRSGELVEITGFAFTGSFLNDNGERQERRYVWDSEGNFIISALRHRDPKDNDLMELVRSPAVDMTYRKPIAVVPKKLQE